MKKNIFKIFFMLGVLMFSFACEDTLEDLYQDPNGYSKEQADKNKGVSVLAGYFTSQCGAGFFLRADYGSLYHHCMSGGPILGHSVKVYYNSPELGTSYTLRDQEHHWGSNSFNHNAFNFINSGWIKSIIWGQRLYNQTEDKTMLDDLYIRCIHLFKAQAYQRAMDQYDVVPYIETGSAGALDGEKASWLGQKEIYPKLIEEVKEVETFLENLVLTDGEQAIFSRQDIIFSGKINSWRKYANSLRLRFAMMCAEQNPEITTKVISELQGKPLFDQYDDVAGLAEIAVTDPAIIDVQVGISRSLRENVYGMRASQIFISDYMNCKPLEKSVIHNGQELKYFDSFDVIAEIEAGNIDPRVVYMFSPDAMGRYVGLDTKWDANSDINSLYNKIMRGYFINDDVLTNVSKKYFAYGPNNEDTIKLTGSALTDLSEREEYLRNELRRRCTSYEDIYSYGDDNNLIAEYNIRPQYNFNMRYPTLHSVEVELYLAEAALRGFGELNGSALEHYKRAIELSCAYWYDLNANHNFNKSTVPCFPQYVAEARMNDMPKKEYDPSAYINQEASRFMTLSNTEKVEAIFHQLHLHYNFFNFEACFTNARRLIKYCGDNPAIPHEVMRWKERMVYPSSIQATDPEAWSQISGHNDYDLPVWFTGRTTKWKNVLE